MPDHHHTGRDAYMALAAMASRTQRLSLFPATSNVATRHPLVLASLVASLDEPGARPRRPDRRSRVPVGREGR
ncbi:hypothetical protein GCM10025868_24080 [Angustibacter aerolatus]|uniref:Luciferase-like domain-containing protein n=1 Tax=Angustibacter aerolatus TaxID=1162965 RepID=A0ABQ6JG40_9ACTN|nr:hypothetical protein GCM10025868_24080 [Angustibacter aerolatus]